MPSVLVLFETSGNQRFIFDTNKLRENVGASELTHAACTAWVREALPAFTGCREVLCTSGKAYVVAPDEAAAAGLIRAVTTKALRDAPGLDLGGVFVPFRPGELHHAIPAAHELLASRKGLTPGPACRFLRLPVVVECRTSGLPATAVEIDRGEPVARSAVTIAKRKSADAGVRRMRAVARRNGGHDIVYALDDLDRLDGVDWLGVVHADGNGLGQVFLKFHEYAQTTSDDDYAAMLRAFSVAVDAAAERAFGVALAGVRPRARLRPDEPLPVVPIVLGGDDLTVVMNGEHAVRFAADYLAAFEKATAEDPTIRRIAGRVTACAGVAVVKPHFPFSAAYHLAEDLLRSAKDFAKPESGLDFHILYDASGPDLSRIRGELRVGDAHLTARPYRVGGAGPRTADDLGRKVAAARAKDRDGRRCLPNSLLHDLRAALFLGREAADAKYDLVRHRYPGFAALFDPAADGMFFDAADGPRTHLLDALDLAGFWPEDRR